MAAFIAPLISGIAGLFGGGKQQQTKTSGTITNNQSGNFNQSGSTNGQTVNATQLSPLQEALMRQFTSGAQDLYKQSTNLQPYANQQLQQINSGSRIADQVLHNNLAARGLSYSPVAATAENQNQLSRISQGNTFLQGLPLLQRQLQTQALGSLENAFSLTPKTTTSSTSGSTSSQGTTSQQGTQTQQGTNLVSGNPLAGAASGFGAGLFAPNGSGGTNLQSILQSLGLGGNNGNSSVPVSYPFAGGG